LNERGSPRIELTIVPPDRGRVARPVFGDPAHAATATMPNTAAANVERTLAFTMAPYEQGKCRDRAGHRGLGDRAAMCSIALLRAKRSPAACAVVGIGARNETRHANRLSALRVRDMRHNLVFQIRSRRSFATASDSRAAFADKSHRLSELALD